MAISQLIGFLYDSAADPQRWPRFIEAISRATGATSGFVVALDDENSPAFYSDFGFDPDFQHAYQGLFRSHDITLDRFLEAGGHEGGWIGTRQALIPDRELERSLFYNEFMRPREIYHQAGLNLGRTGKYTHAGISILRPKTSGEFEEETVQLLRLLAPHFAQGFLLHQQMAALLSINEALRQGFDSTEFAVSAVNINGTIQNETRAFRELIQRHDGLLSRNGRVQAERPEENEKLHRLIQGASQIGAGLFDARNAASPGGAMLLSRRPPRSPLQVIVNPFHSESSFMGSPPCAILCLIDPESKPLPRSVILRQLYRLTPSEAKLVDWLVQGLDVKQTAGQMRITENSARSLLKCVFSKTGIRSQSGLMRMVLHLPSISK
jgi:DNA-binding CsgD family transcriptional regulator